PLTIAPTGGPAHARCPSQPLPQAWPCPPAAGRRSPAAPDRGRAGIVLVRPAPAQREDLAEGVGAPARLGALEHRARPARRPRRPLLGQLPGRRLRPGGE